METLNLDEGKLLYDGINKPLYFFYFNDILSPQFRSQLNRPGLYRITNIKNNICYFGVATNLMTRFSYHKNHLNIYNHDNLLLQDDFNIFGMDVFRFEILKIADNLEEYNKILSEESKIILYCRKINVHIYNLGIKPFKEIKSNSIAKLLNRDKTRQRMAKKWIIIHPNGKEEEITNLRKFCRDNGIKNHEPLIKIADGRTSPYKGFLCKRGDGNIKKSVKSRFHLRGVGNPSSKRYLIECPNGEIKEIVGLKEFSRQNSLVHTSLHNTLTNSKDYKGYRILKKL